MNIIKMLNLDIEKDYINEVVIEPLSPLKVNDFMRLYNEDGLSHMIKNTEYVLNTTYQTLNGFAKK